MIYFEFLILNFIVIRKKSVKFWMGFFESYYNWKFDEKVMIVIEMVRYVLEVDYGWNIIINNGSMANY